MVETFRYIIQDLKTGDVTHGVIEAVDLDAAQNAMEAFSRISKKEVRYMLEVRNDEPVSLGITPELP